MESSDIPDPNHRRQTALESAVSPRRVPTAFRVLLLFVWAILVAGTPLHAVGGVDGSGPGRVESFRATSSEELVRILDQGWQRAALDGAIVPALAPSHLPRGMGDLPVGLKKSAFLRSILPLIVSVNDDVGRERAQVLEVVESRKATGDLVKAKIALVAELARKYRVPGVDVALAEGRVSEVLDELLLRVDQVPVSLALAQAALESGWGSSRFAVEGNSLFGQWVFSSKGMDPADRPEGAHYSVARFRDLRASVAAYVRNLNSSWAYVDYRTLRGDMRASGDQGLDPLVLAGGLLHYSTRREAYVQEVRAVIRGNRLSRFDSAALASAEPTAPAATQEIEEFAMDEHGETLPPDA